MYLYARLRLGDVRFLPPCLLLLRMHSTKMPNEPGQTESNRIGSLAHVVHRQQKRKISAISTAHPTSIAVDRSPHESVLLLFKNDDVSTSG
jgi:hypothetical protein